MNKIQHWLQIGANVGILLGLVLIGAQMHQSNTIAAAELFSDNLESTIGREIGLFGESPETSMARILYGDTEAESVDYFVADRVYSVIHRQLVRAVVLSGDSLYGNNDALNARGFVAVNYHLFASSYGIAWLDQRIEASIEGSTVSNRVTDALVLMREIAMRRLATEGRDERIKHAQEIASQIESLRDGDAD